MPMFFSRYDRYDRIYGDRDLMELQSERVLFVRIFRITANCLVCDFLKYTFGCDK